MTKEPSKEIKKRSGDPVWEEVEREGYNQKPGETPLETIKRTPVKIYIAEKSEGYDKEQTKQSAGVSRKVAEVFLGKAMERHDQMESGPQMKSAMDKEIERFAKKEYDDYRRIGLSVAEAREKAMLEVADNFKDKKGKSMTRGRSWIIKILKD